MPYLLSRFSRFLKATLETLTPSVRLSPEGEGDGIGRTGGHPQAPATGASPFWTPLAKEEGERNESGGHPPTLGNGGSAPLHFPWSGP